jgi:hypothetical protein
MGTRLLRHQLLRAIGIGFLCFFLFSCQYDPWADGFLTTQPAEIDLVGTYRVDWESLTRRISIPMTTKTLSISRDAEIVLSANHKAEFVHVPEVNDASKSTCVISGTGSWQPGRNDSFFVVLVQIQRKDYRQSMDGCEPTYSGALMLYGKKPPYKLHLTISDPDLGDAVQFERAH